MQGFHCCQVRRLRILVVRYFGARLLDGPTALWDTETPILIQKRQPYTRNRLDRLKTSNECLAIA